MAYSVKIRSITLKNFIGIKTGLGKYELTVDFTKLYDKNIILILGDNGTGKTTFTSVLHGLPGTTDKRPTFIIKDKEGLKKIVYDRSDGCSYECKILYIPVKATGGHNTKGFIKKTYPDGGEEELNPNGNITSYKDIIFEEIGLTDAMLRMVNQNDKSKGHVDMTSTERKVNMSEFLPEDIYSSYYAVVDKQYKDMKSRINMLVESLGKMHDEDTVKLHLDKLTNKINNLVDKRDKKIGKIKEYETRINILSDGDIYKRKKKLISEVNDLTIELETIRKELSTLYQSKLSSVIDDEYTTQEKLNLIIGDFRSKIRDTEINLSIAKSTVNSLRDSRDAISGYILEKENMIKDIDTNHSLNELKDILKSYKERYNELEKTISKLNTNLSKDDFIVGYDIISNIRDMVNSILEYDADLVEKVVNNFDISYYNEKLANKNIEREKIKDNKNKITNLINSLNDNSNQMSDILSKRPPECTIDDCPFISNARKWETMRDKLSEYSTEIDRLDREYYKISDEMEDIQKCISIYDKIYTSWRYIETNLPIINKLPYSDVYNTIDKFIEIVRKKGNPLKECDNFESYIEIIECKDEYNNLKYKKIPSIENDIRNIETQGKFISDTKAQIETLIVNHKAISEQLYNTQKNIESYNDKLDYLNSIIDTINKFSDKKNEYINISNNIAKDNEDLKDIDDKLRDIEEYNDKLLDAKKDLKEIDEELIPLSREREIYKTEQIKIADNKMELEAINKDMYTCSIIRDALSIKDDGIPVDALEYFMDSVRQTANVLLSSSFNGSLYLKEFIINSKDFIIPYKKNGDEGMDISFASSAERSFISLCLTLAIIEEVISNYSIMVLDEIDKGFSDHNKYKFIEILGNQIARVGISQVFMITHNYNFYEGYDVGYLTFPGSSLENYDEEDVINIGDCD